MVKKSVVVMPYSKLKHNILKLMAEQGWIDSIKRLDPSESKKSSRDISDRFASLQVKLSYLGNGRPKINSLKRTSKPGRRVYVSKEHVPTVLNGKGLAIISTSQGLLTDKQARAKKVGGEVVCEIY